MSIRRGVLEGVAAGLLFVAVIALVIFGGAWLRGATAGFFGGVDAEVQIESSGSRIANYNHFFDLCAAVESYEDQIPILQDQLANTDEDDQREINRLRSTISGLEGQRARVIRRYNADASKEYTAARFRDSDLPYQLSVEGETNCQY